MQIELKSEGLGKGFKKIGIYVVEGRMANILVIRETSTTGLVLSAFLVDLAGLGLKDAWGNHGFSRADIEKMKSRMAPQGTSLIPCDPSLVKTIVYGGIEWAKKWRFKFPKEYYIWLRLLEPVDQSVINLDLFGKDGKPKKSRESVRRQYEDFVSYFGSDEIFGTGKEILSKYQSFFDYLAFEKKDPQSGQPAASAYEKRTGRSYNSLRVDLL